MPDNTKVTIGYPFYGGVTGGVPHQFLVSLMRLKDFDYQLAGRLAHPGWHVSVSTTDIAQGRNKICNAFLDGTDSEWLWFVDTDQTFPHDILERMLDSADPVERPILSALVMARREPPKMPVAPACVMWDPDRKVLVEALDVPKDRHWQVAATGSGCVLIHRTVLEAMREAHKDDPWPFFRYSATVLDGKPDIIGEDYTFAIRAQALGFTCWVDTTIEAGHLKPYEFTSMDYWAQFPAENRPRRTWAVIPVKDKLSLTRHLISRLRADGDCDGIIVCDNGSGKETLNWLGSQDDLLVVDCAGLGIHEMWNRGVAVASQRSPAGFDVVFLNNDLDPGEHMVAGLIAALRATPGLTMVSPNYDQRPGAGVEFRSDICGERYDGTGGVAGFAFAVPGEWFTHAGYRFPEECRWWYGDNDLLLAVMSNGGQAGIALDVSVVHVDGGGATGDWSSPEMQPQLAADRAAFAARWAPKSPDTPSLGVPADREAGTPANKE